MLWARALGQVLGLEGVRGDLVGSPEQRAGSHGISGGQRKRVNIGLELVGSHLASTAEPCHFLLSVNRLDWWVTCGIRKQKKQRRCGMHMQHAWWMGCVARARGDMLSLRAGAGHGPRAAISG